MVWVSGREIHNAGSLQAGDIRQVSKGQAERCVGGTPPSNKATRHTYKAHKAGKVKACYKARWA